MRKKQIGYVRSAKLKTKIRQPPLTRYLVSIVIIVLNPSIHISERMKTQTEHRCFPAVPCMRIHYRMSLTCTRLYHISMDGHVSAVVVQTRRLLLQTPSACLNVVIAIRSIPTIVVAMMRLAIVDGYAIYVSSPITQTLECFHHAAILLVVKSIVQ